MAAQRRETLGRDERMTSCPKERTSANVQLTMTGRLQDEAARLRQVGKMHQQPA